MVENSFLDSNQGVLYMKKNISAKLCEVCGNLTIMMIYDIPVHDCCIGEFLEKHPEIKNVG